MSHQAHRRQVLPVLDTLEARLLLSTYPDLQNVTHPSDNPTLQGGMDTFSPPVDAQAPTYLAPGLAEMTRTGKPDDVMAPGEKPADPPPSP